MLWLLGVALDMVPAVDVLKQRLQNLTTLAGASTGTRTYARKRTGARGRSMCVSQSPGQCQGYNTRSCKPWPLPEMCFHSTSKSHRRMHGSWRGSVWVGLVCTFQGEATSRVGPLSMWRVRRESILRDCWMWRRGSELERSTVWRTNCRSPGRHQGGEERGAHGEREAHEEGRGQGQRGPQGGVGSRAEWKGQGGKAKNRQEVRSHAKC